MTVGHYIDGQWICAGESVTTTSPSDGETVTEYHRSDSEMLSLATSSARKCFESNAWRSRSRLRAQFLLELADQILAVKEELSVKIALESGKVITQVRHEVQAAINECVYYAGLARATFGRTAEFDEGQQSLFTREPIGVAAIIVPWNAPATLLIRSLAPAVAAGCTSVIKPAHESAGTHGILMSCIANCPSLVPGAINSINDGGVSISKELVTDPEVDVISYTGSSQTGKLIMEASSSSLKRLSLELGGKSPAVIFPSADIENAVSEIVRGSMAHSGQMCTAIGRVIVHSSSYNQVRDTLAKRLKVLTVGHALDESANLGPLINEAAADRYISYVDAAGRDGSVLVGGEKLSGGNYGTGCYVSPTLAELGDLNHPLIQNELFSPFIVLERFDDPEEAISRANATRYGLSASVYTDTHRIAQLAARKIKAGTIWINCHNRLMVEAETGGYRDSGMGRLHGVEGLSPFLETKHIYSEYKQW